ncbi:MAG: sigma 54-interacting transcriptional regulator [Candidatus Wallbacteria bacterium]|nr:sigma 54-interacting transcriptional regulator [Candidatus Wallbacteria bacterium]
MSKAFYTIDDLIGSSRRLLDLKRLVRKVAVVDTALLICGESGCGKELIAQAVHSLSGRSGGFVAVNCGALPRELLESELFGFKKGAFTGAIADRQGKCSSADRGTLFLDEVGELPYDLQSKFLRVLEEKRFCPIGSNHEEEAGFRVVCATNRDLEEMCRSGEFRTDLYHRVNRVRINVPPLRERNADIVELMNFFVEKYSVKIGKPGLKFSTEVIEAYRRYSWPGNVRELENLVEREIIFSEPGSSIIDHVSEQIRNKLQSLTGGRCLPTHNLKELEKLALESALKCSESRDEAALILGISRATLFRKMKEHEIEPLD